MAILLLIVRKTIRIVAAAAAAAVFSRPMYHHQQVDPFDANSPIKRAAIQSFPPDMFFVLRVVQLLRGMANGESVAALCSRRWRDVGAFFACHSTPTVKYG